MGHPAGGSPSNHSHPHARYHRNIHETRFTVHPSDAACQRSFSIIVAFAFPQPRPNLHYEVRLKGGSTHDDIIEHIRARYAKAEPGSGIIYCRTRADCESVRVVLAVHHEARPGFCSRLDGTETICDNANVHIHTPPFDAKCLSIASSLHVSLLSPSNRLLFTWVHSSLRRSKQR